MIEVGDLVKTTNAAPMRGVVVSIEASVCDEPYDRMAVVKVASGYLYTYFCCHLEIDRPDSALERALKGDIWDRPFRTL